MNDKPLVNLEYDEPSLGGNATVTRLEEIYGAFPRVTATPTWTPKKFQDSFAVDTTTNKLYYYDGSAWKSVGGSSAYGGRVLSGATGTLPTGWTVGKNGTPVYTVTHNLGTTAYSVIAFAYGANLPLVFLAYNSNNFTAEFDNATGTAFSTDWNFILTLIT